VYVLPVLQQILASERPTPEVFATACMVTVAPSRDELGVLLAGHPTPLLVQDTDVTSIDESRRGVPLGILTDAAWVSIDVPVAAGWAVLAYTDGLVEGRDHNGEQLWPEGLRDRLQAIVTSGRLPDSPATRLAELIDGVKTSHPRRSDDLAALLLTHRPDHWPG
jgi:serine phosphatase RsbU (regulator of sigma subunit)